MSYRDECENTWNGWTNYQSVPEFMAGWHDPSDIEGAVRHYMTEGFPASDEERPDDVEGEIEKMVYWCDHQ